MSVRSVAQAAPPLVRTLLRCTANDHLSGSGWTSAGSKVRNSLTLMPAPNTSYQ